jgi:Holliday junction DNA helicase RuvA
LKEKVLLLAVALPERTGTIATMDEQLVGDVISALLNLGYKRGEAEKAVRAVRVKQNGTPTLEALLKDTLRVLAREP